MGHNVSNKDNVVSKIERRWGGVAQNRSRVILQPRYMYIKQTHNRANMLPQSAILENKEYETMSLNKG
jgi:hypothetical protein